MAHVKTAADLRRRITNIYISIMLLIFPLFVGFSGYANVTFSKYIFFIVTTALWLAALAAVHVIFLMPKLRPCPYHWAAAAFGLICILSWLFSPHIKASFIGAGRYDGLLTHLLYVCIFLGVSLTGTVEKSHFVCLALGLGICSAVGCVQLFNVDIFGLFPGDYSHYDAGLRYSSAFLGTIGNTNVLSAYCCLAVPILFLIPVLSGKKRDMLFLIPLCPALFMLIRAGVSGGFVGLGCCAIVAAPLLLTDIPRLRRAFLSAAPLLLFAGAALAFKPQYSLRESFSFSFELGALPIMALAAAAFCLFAHFALGRLPLAPTKRSMRIFMLILCAVLLVLGLIFVYFSPAEDGTVYELSQVMHGNIDEKFGSSRILIWRESLALFPQRPLLGGGPDTLALRVDVQFSRFVEETGKTLRAGVDNAHNEYIAYLINTGILGLAAYLIILLMGFGSWLKNGQSAVAAAVGGGLFCYCIQSFFALGLPLVAPIFWICLGLLLRPRRKDTVASI